MKCNLWNRIDAGSTFANTLEWSRLFVTPVQEPMTCFKFIRRDLDSTFTLGLCFSKNIVYQFIKNWIIGWCHARDFHKLLALETSQKVASCKGSCSKGLLSNVYSLIWSDEKRCKLSKIRFLSIFVQFYGATTVACYGCHCMCRDIASRFMYAMHHAK